MGIGVKVHVWGDYALFSRPELKTERYSYDVITPSAARGILDAVSWHPGMRWVIDKIYVKNPICFTSVRRNEDKKQNSGKQCAAGVQWRRQAVVYQRQGGHCPEGSAGVV